MISYIFVNCSLWYIVYIDYNINNMKAINLSKSLQKYTSGWVALDKENNVVAHAKVFSDLLDILKNKVKEKDLTVMAASDNYYGYITPCLK
ncbi:MAG: hypothetical protein UT63_C0028G0003 [Candidatus Gottesmanbacteria bacterium GW2011_GWC2_39_8]|uniref:Uncharacterized protein n=1 Tax=Candidatus Gottesmanbacteria bacterium GW2011_GWC2_39_8 TaxID=1618450 RepID=A0A0G0PXS0_9BACT|nr:MAG: hypothetical protein UT63_C0028G0003 [Candidatus Gottesmanbacteria bacterium GW2011_GWC2_39_8]